jgi:hypothetical protein
VQPCFGSCQRTVLPDSTPIPVPSIIRSPFKTRYLSPPSIVVQYRCRRVYLRQTKGNLGGIGRGGINTTALIMTVAAVGSAWMSEGWRSCSAWQLPVITHAELHRRVMGWPTHLPFCMLPLPNQLCSD